MTAHQQTTLETLTTHAAIVAAIEIWAKHHGAEPFEAGTEFLKDQLTAAMTTDWQTTSLRSWVARLESRADPNSPPWDE